MDNEYLKELHTKRVELEKNINSLLNNFTKENKVNCEITIDSLYEVGKYLPIDYKTKIKLYL